MPRTDLDPEIERLARVTLEEMADSNGETDVAEALKVTAVVEVPTAETAIDDDILF